jgi:hypothetical protein
MFFCSADSVNYKYLGLLIDNLNSMTNIIKEEIQMANKAYYANTQLLKNKIINRRTKTKLYKSLIRPIATCGSEVWTLRKCGHLGSVDT